MTIERKAYDCNKKSVFRFLAVLKYDKDSNMIVIKNQVLGSLPLQNMMKILIEKMFSCKKSVYMEPTPWKGTPGLSYFDDAILYGSHFCTLIL